MKMQEEKNCSCFTTSAWGESDLQKKTTTKKETCFRIRIPNTLEEHTREKANRTARTKARTGSIGCRWARTRARTGSTGAVERRRGRERAARVPLSDEEGENGQHVYRWARERRANRVRSRVCWLDALFIPGCVSLWRCTYFPSMRLLSSVLGRPRRYPLGGRVGRPQECVGGPARRGAGGGGGFASSRVLWNQMELLGFGGSEISQNPLSLSPRHTLLTFLTFYNIISQGMHLWNKLVG
jgi:hypothetical protein